MIRISTLYDSLADVEQSAPKSVADTKVDKEAEN
jgi:hypothetical protein